jgi:hypothetical protein
MWLDLGSLAVSGRYAVDGTNLHEAIVIEGTAFDRVRRTRGETEQLECS